MVRERSVSGVRARNVLIVSMWSCNPTADLVHDAFLGFSHGGHQHQDGGYSTTNEHDDTFPAASLATDTSEMDKYNRMLLEAQTPVFPGCRENVLQYVMEQMKIKVKHKMSVSAFDEIQEQICKLLPDDHNLPKSHYKVRNILSSLGLKYRIIDACPNDCVQFYKEYKDLDYCPVCG